ncbi:MAG: arginine deiminase-related protein [Gemmatimonadales bacterium]|nr:arginine deiminase-related protein [Gemmatimonadales bacterium]
MSVRAASHVLLIAPRDYRGNAETAESNVFQRSVGDDELARLAVVAVEQHRALRNLLVENGIRITVTRALPTTPDAPFCNNWFSTHPLGPTGSPTLVLYPMLAPSRRLELCEDLVAMLRAWYPHTVDLNEREQAGQFLESTGSLCLDDQARVAYAAISPRTDRSLAETWARSLGYRLVAFQATDDGNVPYYHTNVMMFLGHGLAGVCLESLPERAADGLASRADVEASLTAAGLEIVPITRAQVLAYCGNCLPLVTDDGEPVLVMSSTAWRGFTASERARLSARARILHSELTAFETLGGGSARCLLGELF